MNIVIDTNVLLVSLGKKSIFRPIFDAFLRSQYNLCITADIMYEYEEVISMHLGPKIAGNVMNVVENAPNVIWVNNYYKWNMIQQDKDDNKFVDCAISCGAKFLVSNDRHFSVLNSYEFPKVDLINAEQFLIELASS